MSRTLTIEIEHLEHDTDPVEISNLLARHGYRTRRSAPGLHLLARAEVMANVRDAWLALACAFENQDPDEVPDDAWFVGRHWVTRDEGGRSELAMARHELALQELVSQAGPGARLYRRDFQHDPIRWANKMTVSELVAVQLPDGSWWKPPNLKTPTFEEE